MSALTFRDADDHGNPVGPTYYFESIIDVTKSPPRFVVVVTSSSGPGRWQIGPIVLTGDSETERKVQARGILRDVLAIYGFNMEDAK